MDGGEHQHQLVLGADGVPLDHPGGVGDAVAAPRGCGKGFDLRLGPVLVVLGGPAGQLAGQCLVPHGFQPQQFADGLGHGAGGGRVRGGQHQHQVLLAGGLQQLGVYLRPPGGRQVHAVQGDTHLG